MNNDFLKKTLSDAPLSAGVYFFKDKKGKILYVGKASNLKKRLSQYLQKEAQVRPLIGEMLSRAQSVGFIETDSELSALLLESEMIKRYKPKYNERWKDEKNFLWVQITTSETWPKVFLVRRPLPDKNTYFGPFVDAGSLKKSLRALRNIFPFITSQKFPHRKCFWGHLGKCPCLGMERKDYLKNIKNLIRFFKGQKDKIISELEDQMQKLAERKEFEKAALLRDKIFALRKLAEVKLFSDYEIDIGKDIALSQLTEKLDLPKIPWRIECYDISNLFGKDATGSLVVFEGGVPHKEAYRRFKIKTIKKIDDYSMMKEVLKRRFKRLKLKDSAFSQIPDLIIIDGGKGHLGVALKVLKEFNFNIPVIALAKKYEEIYKMKNNGKGFEKIILPNNSPALFLLQRIRDEAHRFAITYHHFLERQKIKK